MIVAFVVRAVAVNSDPEDASAQDGDVTDEYPQHRRSGRPNEQLHSHPQNHSIVDDSHSANGPACQLSRLK